jgi:penicillin-binding protein 1C
MNSNGKQAMISQRNRRRLILLGALLICPGLLAVVAWLALFFVSLPPALFQPPAPSIEFLDIHGQTLREVSAGSGLLSRPVTLQEIPAPLIAATLLAEDQRFWDHPGVDWRAIARAALSLVRHRKVISGGSTITQQLIKLAAPRPRTFRTKLIEAAQALRLEQIWSKERILTEYLNRLDYGHLRLGCAAAARFYFGKPISDLSVAQAALLAGLPQAPSRLNPHAHFARARKRQDWILGRLAASRFLSQQEYVRARREPVRLQPPQQIFQAPHFVDLLLKLEPEIRIQANHQPICTTLDLNLNRVAERVLRQHLARLQAHHAGNGAVVILENRTGNVLALVGSENYFDPDAGQVNGAWAARSAGSTFKPFAYWLALEKGATPATVVADVPTEFPTITGIFSPVNYNHRCYGPMRYRLALANSLNIAAVKVLASVGGPEVLQQRLRACGLTTLNQSPEFYGLGLTIGNAEARLLELVNAYACLACLGEFKPFRLVQSSKSDPQSPMPGVPALARASRVGNPAAAYLIADILSDNFARTLAFGPNSSLRFDFPVACKTGTSTDFRDNWALGYTPEFTVGVWIGNFDGTPMERVSGVSGAAPILHDLFVHLCKHFGLSWYTLPANVVEKSIHPITGKVLTRPAPEAIQEIFLADSLPAMESPHDYDAQGRVRLSPEYRDWFDSGDNWLANKAIVADLILPQAPEGRSGAQPTISAELQNESWLPAKEQIPSPSLRLLSPLPGTTYYLDPDLPDHGRLLRLRAAGPNRLTWRSASLQCRTNQGESFAVLREGRHELTACDPLTGAEVKTWILVKSL